MAEEALARNYSVMAEETLEDLFKSVRRLVQDSPPPPVKIKSRREQLEELFGDPDLDEDLDGEAGKMTEIERARQTAEKIRRLTTPAIIHRRLPRGCKIRAVARPTPSCSTVTEVENKEKGPALLAQTSAAAISSKTPRPKTKTIEVLI